MRCMAPIPKSSAPAVSEGVEKIQEGGADVVLVNMQYSPRTESIVAVGAYADGMRWVSREREVPVFDRLAIMRHWYDQGQFDLYKATKDMKTAKSVHDCLGRALGATDHRRGASGSTARGGADNEGDLTFFSVRFSAGLCRSGGDGGALRPRALRPRPRRSRMHRAGRSDPPDPSAQARRAAHRRWPAADHRRDRLVVDRRRRRKLAGDELSEPARGRAQDAVSAASPITVVNRGVNGEESKRHARAVRPRRVRRESRSGDLAGRQQFGAARPSACRGQRAAARRPQAPARRPAPTWC